MTGYERILATLAGSPADSLALMPITMMFAADQIGAPYGKYAADHRVLVEAQVHTAEKFDFDYVSCVSDPAREAPRDTPEANVAALRDYARGHRGK